VPVNKPDSLGHVGVIRYGFFPADRGVRREVEELRAEGFNVCVVCRRDERQAAVETIDGIHIHRLPVGGRGDSLWSYLVSTKVFCLLATLRLVWLHQRKPFQFVQVNNPPDYLTAVAIVLRLLGAKIILRVQQPVPEHFEVRYSKWYHKPISRVLRLTETVSVKVSDRVIVQNRRIRDRLGERGADLNKIAMVMDVIADSAIRLDEHQLLVDKITDARKGERRQGIFTIVTHLPVERDSGVDMVVKAVARLQDRLPGLAYRLIGGGSYIARVLRLAQEMNVSDRVQFVGALGIDEMIGEILTADIGIVPVKKNPYTDLLHSTTIYDYIAMGKPIIASRLEALTAYFAEDSLIYFESEDADDLAEKIYSVFAYPEDVGIRVSNTSDIYDAHRWERERKKYVGVYQQLLKG